jgi:hypothetical protein
MAVTILIILCLLALERVYHYVSQNLLKRPKISSSKPRVISMTANREERLRRQLENEML